MLRIGEFSNLSQVSVKTLHHYDDIGLLRPARIDAQTGYRYYEAAQITRLVRIRALKNLGFSLDDITVLLRPDVSEVERTQIVTRRREEQAIQVQMEQRRLGRLEALALTPDAEQEADTANGPLLVYKSVPALRVVGWRANVIARENAQIEQEVTARFLTLAAFMQTHRIRPAGDGILVWHDAEWQEEITDVEVGVPIEEDSIRSVPPHPFIRVSELPPIAQAACVTYRGSAQGGQAQAAYAALANALQSQGCRINGLRRDVTLHYDFLTGDRVVEVQFPIQQPDLSGI